MTRDEESYNLEVELLIEALFRRYNYDFRHYARTSIQRRLQHAMTRFHCPTVSHVQARLLNERNFIQELVDVLTVPTTEMFRDASYFLSLRTNVLPILKPIRRFVFGSRERAPVKKLFRSRSC